MQQKQKEMLKNLIKNLDLKNKKRNLLFFNNLLYNQIGDDMKIGIASDHRGYKLKEQLKKIISEYYEIIDYGTNNEESTDYPIYAYKLCDNIKKDKLDFGIVICGTGIGMSIACNKIKGIYCAKVNDANEARYAKEHNNANVLALSEKLSKKKALKMIKVFMETKTSEEEKHKRRRDLIKEREN